MKVQPTLFLIFTLLFTSYSSKGQTSLLIKDGLDVDKSSAIHSVLQSGTKGKRVHLAQNAVKSNWEVGLINYGVDHASDLLSSKIDSTKSSLTMQKYKDINKKSLEEDISEDGTVSTPIVQLDFRGNDYNGWAPPDNDIAASTNGYIISVINSGFLIADINGDILIDDSFSNFLSPLGLTGGYFDPKVIYDHKEDRFIIVVLNGNTPSTSKIVVAFAESSDPTGWWWMYWLGGDPTNNNTWFDFPTIGVSETELYISGNKYNASDQFVEAQFFQINKSDGFKGNRLSWVYWHNLRDSDGNLDFNLCPISYGFNGWTTPGIYLLSSNSSGGSDVMMYYTTNTLDNNPTLVVRKILVAPYSLSGNGLQKGSSDLISTNDCRMLSGFVANSQIHFTMNTTVFGSYNGIYYGKINVDNFTSSSSSFGLSGYEYTYPSIAPFSHDSKSDEVLFSFLRTGSSIYPQFRTVSCDGSFDWSPSILVKAGESNVDYSLGSLERWGDYSGTCWRSINGKTEVWIAGCYGHSSKTFRTWIAKIGNELSAPTSDFIADKTIISVNTTVQFMDLSVNNPDSWNWIFQGGTPSTSTIQNPQVTYNMPGDFNVTLNVRNSSGSDSELKQDYITVIDKPETDFYADSTNIPVHSSIKYFDSSSNSPTQWNWIFVGGSPSNSTQINPVVTYNNPGSFRVSLTTSNFAGSDEENKDFYMNVVLPAIAEFDADSKSAEVGSTISFIDLSQNNPSSWHWEFEEGTPPTSSKQNPDVTYNSTGTFDVSLTVKGIGSEDQEYKNDFIVINDLLVAPIADFMASQTNVLQGALINFINLTTNMADSYAWSFPGGNPSTSNESAPSIQYNTPGNYDVTLTAMNSAGSDSETKIGYITVSSIVKTPEVDFVVNSTNIMEGDQVAFTDLSNNSPTTWTWEFEEGSPNFSFDQNPNVIYNSVGVYDVKLTASNSAGSDAVTKSGYIHVQSKVLVPEADFTSDKTNIIEGEEVTYNDLSSNNPEQWIWQFPGGDPSTSTDENPKVIYNSAGTYSVRLTAINSAGQDVSEKNGYITVESLIQVPQVDFTSDTMMISEGGIVSFTDLTLNDPTFWFWEFEGGNPASSTQQNPVVIFPIAGTYNVKLTAINSAGSDVKIKTDYIVVEEKVFPPLADFEADKSNITINSTVQFMDLSSNDPTEWQWEFDGGTPAISTLSNPSIIYHEIGLFDVRLKVTNSAGSNTEGKIGYINVQNDIIAPIVDFHADNTKISTGGIVTFTDDSQNDPDEWIWSFPSGVPSISFEQNPLVIYPNDGSYNVSLIAKNIQGSSSLTKENYIIVGVMNVVSEIVLSELKIYPVPGSKDQRTHVDFNIPNTEELYFYIYDTKGNLNKLLMNRKVKAGFNRLSFNNNLMPNGTYIIKILDKQKKLVTNAKFIVHD